LGIPRNPTCIPGLPLYVLLTLVDRHSLGDWPYNSAIAYGKASTHMVRKTLKTGKIASQRNLEVHITAEA